MYRQPEVYTAVQSKKAVSVCFTSEQTLPFGFAKQYRCLYGQLSHGRAHNVNMVKVWFAIFVLPGKFSVGGDRKISIFF